MFKIFTMPQNRAATKYRLRCHNCRNIMVVYSTTKYVSCRCKRCSADVVSHCIQLQVFANNELPFSRKSIAKLKVVR